MNVKKAEVLTRVELWESTLQMRINPEKGEVLSIGGYNGYQDISPTDISPAEILPLDISPTENEPTKRFADTYFVTYIRPTQKKDNV